MSKDKSEITKLLSFVRKHEKYASELLTKIYNPYESIDKWVESCNINIGPNAVKSYVLLQHYKKWAKANNWEDKLIAKSQTFNSVMKELFNFKHNKKNIIYYINQKVKYEPSTKDKKEKKGGQRAKQKEIKKEV